MPKPYHHADLRTALIVATRHLLESEGLSAVTVARVAAACDVSVAAPYRHFEHRQALLGAVAAQGFDELGRAIALAAGNAADARSRLVEAGAAYVEFAQAHPHLFTVMFDTDQRAMTTTEAPQALAALGGLIAPLPLRVAPDIALRTAWGLVHGLATLRIGGMLTFTRDDTPERLRDDLRALLDGVLTS